MVIDKFDYSQPENRARVAKVLALCKIVVETVEEAGAEGVPSGLIYSVLTPIGITLEAYESIVQFLIEQGAIRKSDHVLYFVKDIFKPIGV